MKRLVVLGCLGILSLPLLSASAASAAPVPPSYPTLGVDVSWPQCEKPLPWRPAFAVIGVTGGLATNTNPCLSQQLTWATAATSGQTLQEPVQLYVNTANPIDIAPDSWPENNIDPLGVLVNNPYGRCTERATLPCSWQYGWNRAVESAAERLYPAARRAGVAAEPSRYMWWLDVELESTWKTIQTRQDAESNVAVLEGAAAFFQAAGARVGVYSTEYQWRRIVADAIGPNSNLNSLPDWRAGATDVSSAQSLCASRPLTRNGKVVLAQFVKHDLDYNYVCD